VEHTAPDHVAPDGKERSIHFLPTTGLGWWAVALVGIGIGLVAVNGLFMLAGLFTPLFALGTTLAPVGGVVGLVAIFASKDRAVAVFLSLVPLAGTVFTVALILVAALT
jgi:hypothetical protein